MTEHLPRANEVSAAMRHGSPVLYVSGRNFTDDLPVYVNGAPVDADVLDESRLMVHVSYDIAASGSVRLGFGDLPSDEHQFDELMLRVEEEEEEEEEREEEEGENAEEEDEEAEEEAAGLYGEGDEEKFRP
jgi:hypothetical protein